ncbi:MAG TPA: bifunctional adenosylcobinamide kinase/adenosylcobinamide-phosphate guanylyltransferase [Acidimicrobiia bacterium]|nr:bifunctional adenosylcobinamide kinase/adenosylcobinamide-phosphate guanylyltransferase [Acidimicrobiia bacterium]
MIVLVLGGARSGKSGHAEHVAATLPEPVSYVATACIEDDADLAARVAEHRARRPASWTTIETGPDLPAVLRATTGTVLLDALGPWLAAAPDLTADAGALCDALTARDGDTVVVSEEVGLGVHPSTVAGRRFRDALGELNQAVAAIADNVVLVVAGRALRLEAAG